MIEIYFDERENAFLVSLLMYDIANGKKEEMLALAGLETYEMVDAEGNAVNEDAIHRLVREGEWVFDIQQRSNHCYTLLTKLSLQYSGYCQFTQAETELLSDVVNYFLFDWGGEFLCTTNIAGPWCFAHPSCNRKEVVKDVVNVEAMLFALALLKTGFNHKIDFALLKSNRTTMNELSDLISSCK
ncbi:hypothetical protein [Flavisolibacter tropicus]|uniref:Uncharacterized protein n=1 Tax=Flavisolibacter tropicus TaxID=1492898 RepID=A0A172TU75_9BACT|nr:hypothetical protein [Flavisolibacter tropicus]ANE50645.1 hypothetical protein SY85_09155 [Flavisolibacter tropicus]